MHFRFASSAVAQGGRWELPNGSKSVVTRQLMPARTGGAIARGSAAYIALQPKKPWILIFQSFYTGFISGIAAAILFLWYCF